MEITGVKNVLFDLISSDNTELDSLGERMENSITRMETATTDFEAMSQTCYCGCAGESYELFKQLCISMENLSTAVVDYYARYQECIAIYAETSTAIDSQEP